MSAQSKEFKLLAAGALKAQCSESLMGYCNCIGGKFSSDESHGGSCPMCGKAIEKFVCSRCDGEFTALSVSSDHVCQSVSAYRKSGKVAFHEAELAAREAERRAEAKELERTRQLAELERRAEASELRAKELEQDKARELVAATRRAKEAEAQLAAQSDSTSHAPFYPPLSDAPRRTLKLWTWLIIFIAVISLAYFNLNKVNELPRPPSNLIPFLNESEIRSSDQLINLILDSYNISAIKIQINNILVGSQENNTKKIEESISALRIIKSPASGNKKLARIANNNGLKAIKLGHFAEAVIALTQAARSDPLDVEIVNNLAYALRKTGMFAEARNMALCTLSLAPERSIAWLELGAVLADENREEAAIQAFMLTYRFSQNKLKTRTVLQRMSTDNSDRPLRDATVKALNLIDQLAAAS